MKTCPDVVRKHATTPRTYRQVHGHFAEFDDERTYPPRWMWTLIYGFAVVVIILKLVGAFD